MAIGTGSKQFLKHLNSNPFSCTRYIGSGTGSGLDKWERMRLEVILSQLASPLSKFPRHSAGKRIFISSLCQPKKDVGLNNSIPEQDGNFFLLYGHNNFLAAYLYSFLLPLWKTCPQSSSWGNWNSIYLFISYFRILL